MGGKSNIRSSRRHDSRLPIAYGYLVRLLRFCRRASFINRISVPFFADTICFAASRSSRSLKSAIRSNTWASDLSMGYRVRIGPRWKAGIAAILRSDFSGFTFSPIRRIGLRNRPPLDFNATTRAIPTSSFLLLWKARILSPTRTLARAGICLVLPHSRRVFS